MFDQAAHTARRRGVHDVVSSKLAALDDQGLEALLQTAAAMDIRSVVPPTLLELDGVQIFVKKVPLTDIERGGDSTANVFGLPLFYQYGIGSTGFGAWRELAANLMATDWVLAGDCVNFPILYHWRVLPGAPRPPLTPEEEARWERAANFWEDSPAIRARHQAITHAGASLVLFLEYVPETVNIWLTGRVAEGAEAAEAAILKVDEQLNAVADFINARGMLHFDLHFHNVLSDGEQLYVADFGLALCSGFALSASERDFFARHRLYDRCYLANYVVKWIEESKEPISRTPAVTTMIERYRPIAAVMGDF
ncbi:MAG TPA: hypothetical protein VGL73_15320, partial [Caulobacteraceae bacterium]